MNLVEVLKQKILRLGNFFRCVIVFFADVTKQKIGSQPFFAERKQTLEKAPFFKTSLTFSKHFLLVTRRFAINVELELNSQAFRAH